MQHEPNGDCEHDNGYHSLPGPGEVMGLNRKDGDHEIIAESCMTEERKTFGIAAAEPADQGNQAQQQNASRYQEIDGQHGLPVHAGDAGTKRSKVRVKPLSPGPKKAEPGLNGGAEA